MRGSQRTYSNETTALSGAEATTQLQKQVALITEFEVKCE